GQNEKLSRQLEAIGAIPVEFSTIQIVPPEDSGPLDEAIANISDYDWLVLTSVNGVEHFWRRLTLAGKGAADLAHLKTAVIGPATAEAVRRAGLGLRVDLTPEEHIAESLAEALIARGDIAGQNILLPTANIARNALPDALRAAGAIVNRVTAYQTKPVSIPGALPYILPEIDILTFTSPSTARNFVSLLSAEDKETLAQKTVACIGPVTAKAARQLGLRVDLVPDTYTISGLIEALETQFKAQTVLTQLKENKPQISRIGAEKTKNQ
ncbi:MAG TPA: uroporphyrinogen-III synthase, partial [Anaerolineae bacterium]|nr:uroporphyrinogen-III synthase [Anaerolineae bacterium]